MTKEALDPCGQAGDAFETLLGFVNTRSDPKDHRVERFGNASDFCDWARDGGLLYDQTVSESEAAAARELRSALVTIMLAHANSAGVSDQQIADAERYLAHAGESYPVKVTISAAGSAVAGHSRGAAGVLGGVLAAANELVQQGNWGRMKACSCGPCEKAFADRTKAGNQLYCGPSCASRAAMRAMRERRRADS
jgi:predicted RNA-binding Zn ribbon-like protein